MRLTQGELNRILYDHEQWLINRALGKRADLSFHDLRDLNLKEANLSYAIVRSANLTGLNLSNIKLDHAQLQNSNFSETNLHAADFSNSDIYSSNFYKSQLSYSNFVNAIVKASNFNKANLENANLYSVDFKGSNFKAANLKNAFCRKAILNFCNLSGADITGTYLYLSSMYNTNIDDTTVSYRSIIPETGEIKGWIKCNDKLLEILIPDDAKRSNATTRFCRCEKAKVLNIYNLVNMKEEKTASLYGTLLHKGEVIKVKKFDDNKWNEYGAGIGFYTTKNEAIAS